MDQLISQFITELWGAAKTAGPATTMLFFLAVLWINRERERLIKQLDKEREKNEETVDRAFKGLHDAADAVKDLRHMLMSGGQVRRREGG